MKKAVIALLALCISLVAAVALVGCGGSGPADKKADFIWFKVEVPEGVSVSNSAGDNAKQSPTDIFQQRSNHPIMGKENDS